VRVRRDLGLLDERECRRGGKLLDDNDAERRDCSCASLTSIVRFGLDPEMKDVGLVSELLKPCNARTMCSTG
jgi:hypothetical protein